MSANEPQLNDSSTPGPQSVKYAEWGICLNPNDNNLVLSATVASVDGKPEITGVGLILNTRAGTTLVSCYVSLGIPSNETFPSINLPAGDLKVGDHVNAVIQGECNKQHFFYEKELVIEGC